MKIDLRPYTGSDKWFSQPFTVVDTKSQVWNVATDRVWLVAQRGRSRYPRWLGDMAQLSIILGLIQSPPLNPRIANLFDLKEWADNVEGSGRILGVTVDLGKLSELLRLPTHHEVQVWDASSITRQEPCLVLDISEDFRAILMGQTPGSSFREFDESLLRDIPEPEPITEELDALDLAMSLESDGSE